MAISAKGEGKHIRGVRGEEKIGKRRVRREMEGKL